MSITKASLINIGQTLEVFSRLANHVPLGLASCEVPDLFAVKHRTLLKLDLNPLIAPLSNRCGNVAFNGISSIWI
ncbi:hypothetical protein [Alteromonas facilis]|uniref:hypothetical protein n=1 Tax=Alteromonas facilis TaxID=2048004 RepID=UPI00196B7C40|nr:hypothetical protein [Alteromonas facilis]